MIDLRQLSNDIINILYKPPHATEHQEYEEDLKEGIKYLQDELTYHKFKHKLKYSGFSHDGMTFNAICDLFTEAGIEFTRKELKKYLEVKLKLKPRRRIKKHSDGVRRYYYSCIPVTEQDIANRSYMFKYRLLT